MYDQLDFVQVGDRIFGEDGFGGNWGTVTKIAKDRWEKKILILLMDEKMEDGSDWYDTAETLTTRGIGWYWRGHAVK